MRETIVWMGVFILLALQILRNIDFQNQLNNIHTNTIRYEIRMTTEDEEILLEVLDEIVSSHVVRGDV